MDESNTYSFTCDKCGCTYCRLSELRGSSGGLSAYMDIDLAIFTAVSCQNCGLTQFYDITLKDFMRKHNIKNSGNKPWG